MPHVRNTKSKVTTENRDVAKGSAAIERRRRRHTGAVLNLDGTDATIMHRAIINVLKGKVGITLGVTRDGGALSVVLLFDGEPQKDYVRATESIDDYFRALAEDFSPE